LSYFDDLPEHVRNPDPLLYTWQGGVPLFLDFETTNHSNGSALDPRNRLVMAAWQRGHRGTMEVCWGSEFEQDRLLQAIEASDYIVAHNAKFELQWLARCGADLTKLVVYDTMIAEYVIGGNRYMMHQLGLSACLTRYGLEGKEPVVGKMINADICPSEIPREWLEYYCVKDVEALPRLMRKQLQVMDGTRLLPVVYNRCLLTPVLAEIEAQGMQLDANLVRTKYEDLVAQQQLLETKMNAMTGGINSRSRPQLAAFLYETLGFEEVRVKRKGQWEPKRTPAGARCTDTGTIEALKATTKAQREFLEVYLALNDVLQKLSKYFEKFADCCAAAAGVLYANFNQTNTQTHRLSSTGREYAAQFQNFPREYKPIFRARREGYLMAEADGAQLEFRVAADLGQDEVAFREIEEGVDVHSFTAKVMTEAGQPTSRQDAKAHTFKPLYGGKSGTSAEQAYYAAFRLKYPGIAAAQQSWIAEVLDTKMLETKWGLRYYWPDTRMDRSGYVTNSTAICNYPVQGFATAEIIPAALVLMWHVCKAGLYRIHIVNTIHDSIAAEVHPDDVDSFHDIARWALIDGAYHMMQRLYGIRLRCRLGCGVKVATHWGATKDEKKYEATREQYA
jgi:DNA polymerase I-like protein with 3'-5' exonuclease and polymerase domains